ncbi:MAG: hypothetical protein Q7J75_00440 [Rhodoferax sp.]|nr:hypothetical protein [Rhodoferax sp.]
MSIKKPAPRFLPTLTEVVHPLASSVEPVMNSELLVERLLQRVAPAVEAQLRETLRVLIQEQILLLTPRFQQEIETAVRQAVAGAMAEVEISRP